MRPFILILCAISLLSLLFSSKIDQAEKLHGSANFTKYISAGRASQVKATPRVNTDTADLKKSGWYNSVIKNIDESEYYFRSDEKNNVYVTPNRKNNLRFTYSENGFTVGPRLRANDDWKIDFQLDRKQIGSGVWYIKNNTAEYVTDNITVQYINNEKGMRQNFIVKSPLSSTNDLKVNFNVQTQLRQILQNNRIRFINKANEVALNYEGLQVWDANGKPLEASIGQNGENDYSINVNTLGATYPVTIDPLSTGSVTVLEYNQAGSSMGKSVASAGDVNGDGYSDVLVGAPKYDNGQTDEGVVFVYYGSASGIGATANVTLEPNQAGAGFGNSVSTAGDVNGDGYSDVVVGANFYANGQSQEGATFIYHGSASGLTNTPAVMLESNQVGAQLGTSVACAGDVNADGFSDIVAGGINFFNGQSQEGGAWIFKGSATGISDCRSNESMGLAYSLRHRCNAGHHSFDDASRPA